MEFADRYIFFDHRASVSTCCQDERYELDRCQQLGVRCRRIGAEQLVLELELTHHIENIEGGGKVGDALGELVDGLPLVHHVEHIHHRAIDDYRGGVMRGPSIAKVSAAFAGASAT
ncbi:hypothetical protein [Nocardia sp. NPDC059691]|uniref:hypothetical protein n=1 Tax=Nocardia sp. NPDC059691 TaxID=3346908 RepID=UPI0036AB8602